MSGFVDLRLNRRHSEDEGFWPSFTDIMTVIVMIFLLGMVVVILQNIEVTNNMKAALLEKQRATELAESTSQEKSIVSNQLSDAEEELARLRMLIILSNDRRKTMEGQLSTAQKELQSLSGLYSALQETHDSVKLEKENVEKQLEEKSQILARIEARLNELIQRQTVLTSKLARSKEAQKLSESKLSAITLQAASADQELASIRGEYSNLQVKYDRLIKPARTSKGKHVVEVFYAKKDKNHIYKIRDTGQSSSAVVSKKQLHSRLAKLKKQYGKNLYIRLIFPEDSRLSYNDAWKFSKDILGKYDYYHAN
ncbi:chromosome partition protein Smc [bacterium BMS3Abin11]|nr:chromosome partition protein Smc [bacterium BMS3Abin11]